MRVACRILYWILTIPYVLMVTAFALGIPYAIKLYIQGGLPEVKSWLFHLQGLPFGKGTDYWTWPHALEPLLVNLAVVVVLWAARRLLQHQFHREPEKKGAQ